MKTICHATSIHSVYDVRIFHKECRSLANAGYEIYLLAPDCNDHFREGVKIIGLTRKKNRIAHFILISFYQVIIKALKTKAEIFHFHDPELMFSGIILRLLGRKVIYDVHEIYSAALLSKPYLRSILLSRFISALYKITERFSSLFYNRIVAAWPGIAEQFKDSKTVVINNFPIQGYEIHSGDLNLTKTGTTIIYVGGLTRIRGIKQMIQAFHGMDNVELWLLGNFESEGFRSECEEIPGWDKVRYLGSVPHDEVYKYIQLADIGIINMLPVPNYINCLPIKVFEYMLCSKPMIMSGFELWRSMFDGGAVFANPEDPEDIAKKINDLVQDPLRMKQMGKYNRMKAETSYLWEKEAKKLIGMYADL